MMLCVPHTYYMILVAVLPWNIGSRYMAIQPENNYYHGAPPLFDATTTVSQY